MGRRAQAGEHPAARLTAALLALALAGAALAQPRARLVSDDEVVAQSRLAGSGRHVDVYAHDVRVSEAFVRRIDEGFERVAAASGLTYDTATLGRPRVYVSNSVPVSHVWRGYNHPRDPRGIVFLNPRAQAGVEHGRNGTYLHELTHLFSWRYQSLSLREGFADYIALQILPGVPIGPNADPNEVPSSVPAEVLEQLGTTRAPPDWLTGDPRRRALFYAASYRLVRYLIEAKGLEIFYKLYASQTPEKDVAGLYGMSREQAVDAALRR